MNCEVFREMTLGPMWTRPSKRAAGCGSGLIFESAQPAASLRFERNPACSSPWLRQRQASPGQLRPVPPR